MSFLKPISAGLGLACLLFANHAGAAVTYWDPQGTTGPNPNTGSMSGTWETNSWSTAATGSASPVAWIEGTAAVFGVNTGNGTPAYTVTMNSDHNIAGAFDGSLAPNSCDVTITGTGQWKLSGAQGFNLNNASDGSLAFVRINVPIVDANYVAGFTTGQVIAQGNGQLFLNGVNTYSGGTGGSFTLGNGGTLLGYASSNFNGIVNFNNNSSFGTGSITVMRGQSGSSGALVAENSGITIPNTLDFSQSVLSGGAVNTAPFLNIVGSSVASGGTTFSGPVLLGNRSVNLGSGATGNLVTLSGVVSGTGSLTKFNASTLALSGANTYSGATTIGNGILSVASLNKVSGGSASSNLGHPTTVANGTIGLGATTTAGTLTYTGGGETTDRVINLAGTTGGGTIDQSGTGVLKFTSNLTATGAGAKTLTLQGSTAGTGEIAGAIVNSSSATNLTKAGTGTWVISGANTYTGTTTVSAGTLQLGAAGVIPDASPVVLSNVAGAILDLNNFSETIASLATGGSTGGNVTLGSGTLTLASNSGTATSYAGIISGTGGVIKSGTAQQNLSGASTFTGGFNLGAGIVGINNNAALGAANSAVTIAGGTTIALSATTARTATYAYSVTGDFTIGLAAQGTAALTMAGTMDLNGATRAIALGSSANTISAVISNGGLNVNAGSGNVLSITGANTYSGDTTLTSGTASLNGTSTLGDGTGAINFSGGTLRTSASRTPSSAPVANPINLTTDAAITTSSTAATVDLNLSSNTIGGSAGTLTFRNDAASGTGQFEPRFSGTFTFARPIAITNFGTNVTSTTRLNSFNTAATGDQTFSGVISGNGGFRRSASTAATGGKTIFTAANTYTGDTNVNDGTLQLNTGASIAGAVFVGDGNTGTAFRGTLAGTGSITGLTTVREGGTIAPGASIGTLTLNGGLTLAANSTLNMELGAAGNPGTSDLINVTNTDGLTINGGTLNLSDAGGLGVGTYTLIDYAGTLGGSLGNLVLGNQPSGFTYSLVNNTTNTSIDLTVAAAVANGDWNGDTKVNAADYITWRKDPTTFGGDGGYTTWRQNFDLSAAAGASLSGASPVPEPASICLLMLAFGAIPAWRRRR